MMLDGARWCSMVLDGARWCSMAAFVAFDGVRGSRVSGCASSTCAWPALGTRLASARHALGQHSARAWPALGMRSSDGSARCSLGIEGRRLRHRLRLCWASARYRVLVALSAGSYGWFLRLALTAGSYGWLLRLALTAGSYSWLL